jgi:hypothetical protein
LWKPRCRSWPLKATTSRASEPLWQLRQQRFDRWDRLSVDALDPFSKRKRCLRPRAGVPSQRECDEQRQGRARRSFSPVFSALAEPLFPVQQPTGATTRRSSSSVPAGRHGLPW